jgi:eukaryotic-like serine/threonine-protein kinase
MPDSGQDLSNAVADRYRVEREIGRGGMASVFLAHDLRHDRDVAIKVLHPELAAALGADRFLAEIKTTARLQHPHILPLLDSGEANGVLFYVMPFVAGETLRARLDREHLLPIDDAIRIAREVADALEYAHRIGVIHRDIKPENILLQDGHALVADFGIALAVQQAGGARMTQTGLSLGTPQYMSPEQAMGERTIDARSDQYALAAVVYEMLVGDPPFTGSTVQAIVAKLMTERPGRIVTQRDRVPVHVETAVLRALEKIPADRWANVHEFMDAMRDATPAPPTGTTSADVKRGVSQTNEARAQRTKAVALGAALLVVGAASGWVASRSTSPSRGTTSVAIVMTSIVPPPGGNFGEQQSLALSPDGRRLAFVFAAPDGSHSLWIRDIDKLDAKPIAGTTGADIPFWSRDGHSVGFFAAGYLQVMEPTGDVRRLCPVGDPNAGSWSASDVILFSDRRGISSVSASGSSCRMIIPYDSGSVLRALFLPDGKHFIYSHGRFADLTIADGDGKSLGTIPVQTQVFTVVEPDLLIYAAGRDQGAIDEQRVNFAAIRTIGQATRLLSNVRSRSGIHTFTFSREGTLAYLPGSGDLPYLDYDASGLRDTIRIDGTWTVSARPPRAGPPTIAVAGNGAGVWLYDLAAARASRLVVRDTGIRNPRDGVGATWPVFSPDGSRLAYMAASTRECRLNEHDLKRDADRVIAQRTFVAMYGCGSPVDWSQDGTKLLIKSDTALEVMSLDGKVTAQIARPGTIWEGHFSQDAKSVVFSSDETGRAEVYVMAIAGGVPTRISLDGGRWPAWTADGRRIVFMSPVGKVQEVTMNGGSPSGAPRTLFIAQNWRRSTFDDRGVGFAVVGNGEHYIVRQSPSAYAVAYVQHWKTLLPPE